MSHIAALRLERRRRARTAFVVLAFALVATCAANLALGALDISVSKIAAALLEALGISAGDTLAPHERSTLFAVRFPRVALGLLVGSALALSGAAMQSIFRNPLVEPGLLGVASGAALGAMLAIVLGDGLASQLPPPLGRALVPAGAFVTGLLSAWAVTHLGRVDGRTSTAVVILAGIAVNSIAGAGIGLLTYLANDAQLRTLTFWTLGSLSGATWPDIRIAVFLVVVGSVILVALRHPLAMLELGEREASHLGVDVERTKRIALAVVALLVGAAVSLAGVIGFVGLVVPHLVRMALGHDARLVIPASLLAGGTLLIAADLAARTLVAPAELPLGVVTSAIGGPFLFFLVLRHRRSAW